MKADAETTSDSDYAERFIEQALPFVDQLYSGARRLTATQYDAEDLVQETMLSGFKGFRLYREGTNLRAWLFRIMFNTWVSGYRARQRRPNEVLCDEFADWQTAAGGSIPIRLRSAEIEALERMPDQEIVAALDQLPETQRMTVYLADVEGYRYREIAALTNVPVGTVMSRLARGRRRLRELLADVGNGLICRAEASRFAFNSVSADGETRAHPAPHRSGDRVPVNPTRTTREPILTPHQRYRHAEPRSTPTPAPDSSSSSSRDRTRLSNSCR